jgi:hypothetical protein
MVISDKNAKSFTMTAQSFVFATASESEPID